MKPIEKAERYTLSKQVVQNLKRYILEQRIAPGGKLPAERELAKIMNVSRAILREALRSLESAGILEIRHGEGAFIADLNLAPLMEQLAFSAQLRGNGIAELAGIRRLLEMGAVDALLADGREIELAKLSEAAEKADEAEKSGDAPAEAELRFHLAIFEPLGNETMSRFADQLIRLTQPHLQSSSVGRSRAEGRRRFLDALQRKDAADAKRWLLELLKPESSTDR
jgi:DNA-binding FadR family transcriptional regulator